MTIFALKEMVEPDCVDRLVKLLPLLVSYIEQHAVDTVNRVAVQELHIITTLAKGPITPFKRHKSLSNF